MTISANTLKRLAALKLPTEAFQEVVAILAEVQDAEAQRRAKHAEWKREWRAKHVHGPSMDRPMDPPQHILPPLKKEIQKAKKLSVSMRKQALPEGFQLSVADIDYARSKGWSDNKIADEEQRFINHARATGRRQVDWAAAWRMWVTSPFQQKPSKVNGHDSKHSLLGALDRLDERLEQALASADGEQGGPDDLFRLPER